MVWLFPIWLGLFVVLVGCGLALSAVLARVGGASFRAPLSTFQCFWFGYALSIGLLALYSLLLPIRWPAPVVLGAIACAGYMAQHKVVIARLRGLRARPLRTLGLGCVALLVSVLVAAHAARPVGWYDTHLYHLQVVKWTRSYAAVPGIGNLHYRLAYNNSIHLFGALLDTLWKGRAAHFTLGPLVIVTTLQLVQSALGLSHARARLRAAYAMLVLPFVLGRIASHEIASLSSDLPLNLLCIVVVLELLGLLSHSADAHTRRSDLPLALVVGLASVATTTKLGGLGVLLVSALTALVALRRGGWGRARLIGFALLPTLVLLGYFGRQAVLSGWLLFPAPMGNLHLPWSLPEAEALNQFRWIQSWARMPGLEPADVLDHGFWRWFEPWFKGFAGSQEFTVLLLSVGVALARLARGRRAQLAWHAPALAASVMSLVIWYRGAPDLRFGAGFFWMVLAVVSAPLLAEALRDRSGRLLGLVLCLGLAHWTSGLTAELPHGKYRLKLPAIKQQPTREVEVSPGLRVRIPDGDEDRCSNEPLPCTPYPAKQRLRRDGDLGHGFLY